MKPKRVCAPVSQSVSQSDTGLLGRAARLVLMKGFVTPNMEMTTRRQKCLCPATPQCSSRSDSAPLAVSIHFRKSRCSGLDQPEIELWEIKTRKCLLTGDTAGFEIPNNREGFFKIVFLTFQQFLRSVVRV